MARCAASLLIRWENTEITEKNGPFGSVCSACSVVKFEPTQLQNAPMSAGEPRRSRSPARFWQTVAKSGIAPKR